jgi:tetratricopeptide (TPR) repeat protein
MSEVGSSQHFLTLGLRMAACGDLPRAKEAFLRAANSGDPELAPRAALELGRMLAFDDPAGAEDAFRMAIGAGHQLHGTRAAFELGTLYQKRGHFTAALVNFEAAAQSPDDGIAAQAKEAVRSLGDVAVELQAEMSPGEAAFNEGCHLRAAGDLPGAVAALQRAIATGDPEYSPYAACQLGAILSAEGDFARAKPPLRLAVLLGHAEFAPMAAYVLAEIHLEEGDRTGACELLPVATRHPDPDTAGRAAAMLSDLRSQV